MKKLITIVALITVVASFGQTNQPPPSVGDSLVNLFNLYDTNSLVNARELNVTPLAVWHPEDEKMGGGVKMDWWVTDQQGAFLRYDEFSDRTSFLSSGYQMRTVFGNMEVSLGVGIKQDMDNALGESMQGFVTPQITHKLIKTANWDVRLTAGADIATQGKPQPFVGLTFRATKM